MGSGTSCMVTPLRVIGTSCMATGLFRQTIIVEDNPSLARLNSRTSSGHNDIIRHGRRGPSDRSRSREAPEKASIAPGFRRAWSDRPGRLGGGPLSAVSGPSRGVSPARVGSDRSEPAAVRSRPAGARYINVGSTPAAARPASHRRRLFEHGDAGRYGAVRRSGGTAVRRSGGPAVRRDGGAVGLE